MLRLPVEWCNPASRSGSLAAVTTAWSRLIAERTATTMRTMTAVAMTAMAADSNMVGVSGVCAPLGEGVGIVVVEATATLA